MKKWIILLKYRENDCLIASLHINKTHEAVSSSRERKKNTHTQSRCLPQINHANRSAFYFDRELPSNKQFRKLRECLKRRIEAKHKYIKQTKQRCLSIKQNAAKYLAFFGLQLIFKQWKMIN